MNRSSSPHYFGFVVAVIDGNLMIYIKKNWKRLQAYSVIVKNDVKAIKSYPRVLKVQKESEVTNYFLIWYFKPLCNNVK